MLQSFHAVLALSLLGFATPAIAQAPLQSDNPPQVVILQYHHISTATPASTSISPADFRLHMQYLQDNDFTVVRLETAVNALRSGEPLPARAAVLTFDDGYTSVYEEAFPLLKEYGWPFTIFVPTGLIGSNQGLYASWDQLREMGAAGATLANHSVSHPYFLARSADEDGSGWLARIEQEIRESEATLARETGQNHQLLAYPYGEYDPALQAMVREMGYVGIGQHSGPVGANSDFSALPRFPFSGIYASLTTFAVKVNSLAFNVKQAEPASQVTSSRLPEVLLDFDGSYRLDALTCFNNDKPMQLTVEDAQQQLYRVVPLQENHSRRFRYNCTAPGPSGRYYWYTVPWVNPALTE